MRVPTLKVPAAKGGGLLAYYAGLAEELAAHDAAVEAAMGWFQRHGAVTRRGTDGVLQVDTLGVTAALFRQQPPGPSTRSCTPTRVISAKVQDDSAGWFALDARFMKRQQLTIGWVYDAALRAELTGRLRSDQRPPRRSVSSLPPGVPASPCNHRHAQDLTGEVVLPRLR